MAYWERLADIINNEVVQEHDRVMMAMLKPLGIEKGKPFNPTPRQKKKLLEEAALVGEAMAKANTYEKRIYFGPKAPAGKEKNWIPTEPYFERSWKLQDIEKVK